MSTPVVLLHPLGVDHRFWDPVRTALPPGLGPVLVPDLPGHGRARWPREDGGIEALAAAVREEVADAGPVHLVGVSLGGLVAQVLAGREPDLVDRLVLADTVAVYPPTMQSMWRERAGLVREQGLGAVAEPMESLWFSAAYREDAPERVAAVRALLLENDPEGYARTCEALAVADTRDLVGSITAPTVVACGKEDAPPFRAATEWLVEHLPDGRATWLSGAHASAYEHPREFADLLADFLR